MSLPSKEEYRALLAMVQELGVYQKENLNKAHTIESKSSDYDLVTEVDKESERRIRNFLLKNFPKDSILGEEGTNHEASSGYTWIVDPLDGTVNYAHGFPIFAISIGLEKGREGLKRGDFVFGLIHIPVLDETFWAEKGKGTWLNGKKISVTDCQDLDQALLATGFAYVREGPYDNIPFFNHMYKITRGIRRAGAAAFDLACVAAGRFDGFWEFNLSPWDVSAGMGIIEEAGGKIVNLSASDRGSSLIAGSKILSDKIYNELKKVNENL